MDNTYNGGSIRLTNLSSYTIHQYAIHSLLETLLDNIQWAKPNTRCLICIIPWQYEAQFFTCKTNSSKAISSYFLRVGQEWYTTCTMSTVWDHYRFCHYVNMELLNNATDHLDTVSLWTNKGVELKTDPQCMANIISVHTI